MVYEDKVYKIKDVTELGKNINEIARTIEKVFSKYETIEIENFGIVDNSNRDIVLKSIKLIINANSKLWSKSSKNPNKKDRTGPPRKISEDQENEIVNLALSGTKRVDIAKKYDISTSTLARILKRKNIKISIGGRPKLNK